MKRNSFLIFLFLAVFTGIDLCAVTPGKQTRVSSTVNVQDTDKIRQLLYNGAIWKNMYHRITGDQFLLSSFFLPGSVSINGRTFENVRIKYDIFSDEIITPVNRDDILQLNKEMVDSFTISFENKVYRFINIREDTLRGFSGYLNILYKGTSSYYVKYKKSISPSGSEEKDGNFIQSHQLFFARDNRVWQITSTRDFLRVLNSDIRQIRNFIKKNNLRITKEKPDSFVPVIRFSDSITG